MEHGPVMPFIEVAGAFHMAEGNKVNTEGHREHREKKKMLSQCSFVSTLCALVPLAATEKPCG